MGELKDEQESRKRKKSLVPYYDSSSQGYTFQNAFATYAAAFSTVVSAPTSGYSQDEGSGHDPKKFKTVDSSHLSLKADSFSSLAAPATPMIKGSQDISGSPEFSTPSSFSGKFYRSCPSSTSSITPSSVLSSQDSMNSTVVGRSMSSLPSLPNRENSLDLREDVSHGDQLDLLMARRLFERSTTKGIFNNLKADLQPVVVKRLKELSELKPTFDVGLEMADSAYLLKLLNSWNPQLETVGKKAHNGAMLLQEGVRLIAEAQGILQSVVFESSTSED